MAALRAVPRGAVLASCSDAVYKRRGWNDDGIPTVEKLHELGIDYPDVVALVEANS